ncbi:Sphingomyelin phosphodiesterase [Quillaja saponaria]|uniref:Sphingomyelin phosphodiesterase n=1 Tax=Quillaja saponaria TaxID=32244 RepID=A0AAD7L6U7_QUISA|nr:Sphingomyelin phosphodiesterase [Quillaja saponaria]
MLPHSYTVDSQSKSQDLAHTIIASSSSAQIFSTCAAVESFLQSPDQSRHFFSLAFPALICKLFGFDDANSSAGPQISLKELDVIIGESPPNARRESSHSETRGYTHAWQGYVLSNYLYNSSLDMHFIGFEPKFLHSDVEIIVQMVLKVLNTLTSSKVLIDLLRNVDTAFHSKQAGSGKSVVNSLQRYIPSILEQLQDWEDGLCKNDGDGSFLHENRNKDLKLFSAREDGGQQLLQSLSSNLFLARQCWQSRDEIFKRRRGGNHALDYIKYRGDWMKRPISNHEVAWLVRLLVRLSAWLNESLRLNQAENSQVDPTWSYMEVSTDVVSTRGPSETVKAVLCAVVSWFLLLGAGVPRLMRKFGSKSEPQEFSFEEECHGFGFVCCFYHVEEICCIFS